MDKTKEQLNKELNKSQKECLDLLKENSSLRKQVDRLMKVIAFLTKGE
jgi:septal ring factor EnvC (AmiA/AmiB activator)